MRKLNVMTTSAAAVCLVLAGHAHAAPIADWQFEIPGGSSAGDAFVSDTDTANGLVANVKSGSPTYAAVPNGVAAAAGAGAVRTNGGVLQVNDNDALTGHANGGTGLDYLRIDAWINTTNSSSSLQQITRKMSNASGAAGYLFYVRNGDLNFEVNDGSSRFTLATNNDSMTTNTWHHVTAIFDGVNKTMELLLNGSSQADKSLTSATTITLANDAAVLGIGGLIRDSGSTGQQFQGDIARVILDDGAPIPEPASLALTAMGALAFLRRKH
ncbi:LamG-like jellyroll fold domain-containing protein [Poriferisphaera sp. WC338]|uniref:LamG-like jellyroll fold domain-containing protein n=1 Tax=Poriferisphaera sp. WC338 TaxID=3425129 RepID=UPI003D819C6C